MEAESLEGLVQAVSSRLFVELEASGRHVHVTQEQAKRLFGHPLTPKRPLSQPGQFLAQERVSIVGPKGRFDHVAVLGPERSAGQVEISLTDGKTLGIQPPIRLSGDGKDSPGILLEGPMGSLRLPEGVICAKRHIHMTPEDAARWGVKDGETVKLQVYTKRSLVFGEVTVRVSPDFATYVHLDYDEANACAMIPGDLGRILP